MASHGQIPGLGFQVNVLKNVLSVERRKLFFELDVSLKRRKLAFSSSLGNGRVEGERVVY